MTCLSLLACFLLGLTPAQDQDKIQKLIQSLSDGNVDERNKAVEQLAAIGKPALDALRKAQSSSDPEIKGLATQAIEKMEWVGLEKLRKYVKEQFDDGTNPEPAKMKGLARWFPETRFYEVAGTQPANGRAAMMGMPPPQSLFAIRKFEPGFQRLVVKGVYSTGSISQLVQKEKILLSDDDAALDFAIAFSELYSSSSNQNAAMMMMMGGGSKLEKTSEGWSLQGGGLGSHWTFKTGKDGQLLEVIQKASGSNPFGAWAGLGAGGGGVADPGSEERHKLEVEKLKLEIEVLKRQLPK